MCTVVNAKDRAQMGKPLAARDLARVELVAIDLDGTLLGPDGADGAAAAAVPSHVAAGLGRAASLGLRLTLATGRMYRSAVQIADELGLDVPLITYNGGLIKRPGSPQPIGFFPLGGTLAREALAYVGSSPGTQAFVYVGNSLMVARRSAEVDAYCERCRVTADVVSDWDLVLGDAGRSASLPAAGACAGPESIPEVIKVLIVVDRVEEVPRHIGALRALFDGRARVVNSMPTYAEICSMEASKGRALLLVARNLGLCRSQVAAIGDSGNDLEMVASAGVGIAVANALDDVKQAAHVVTRASYGEGVLEALGKLLEARGS